MLPADKTQSLINSFDQGKGLLVLRTLIVVLGLAALLGFYVGRQFRGLSQAEAMEYCQLGRNIAQGRGFTTDFSRPFDLWYMTGNAAAEESGSKFDIRHPPLYPLILGGAFRIIDPSYDVSMDGGIYSPEKFVVVPLGILFYVLTGLMVFLMGLQLSGVRVAMVATLAFVFSRSALDQIICGLPDSLTVFLIICAFYFVLVFAKKKLNEESFWKPAVALALCSVFCGLSFLSDYRAAALLPGIVLCAVLVSDRYRWFTGLAIVLIAGAIAAPWLVRNHKVSGGLLGTAPYSVMNGTARFPGNQLEREYEPAFHRSQLTQTIRSRLISNVGETLDFDLRTVGEGFVVSFFLVSFFLLYDDRLSSIAKWCALLVVPGLLFFSAIQGGDGSLLSLLWPVVAVLGVQCFLLLLERQEIPVVYQTWLCSILIALSSVSSVSVMFAGRAGYPYPPYFPPFISYVSGMVDKDEVICTDIPAATAWYGRRKSMLLPATVDQFVAIANSGVNFGGIYLTTETGNKPYINSLVAGFDRSWLPFLNRRIPEGLPFDKGIHLPVGTRDQLFLADDIKLAEPIPEIPEEDDKQKEKDIDLIDREKKSSGA